MLAHIVAFSSIAQLTEVTYDVLLDTPVLYLL